MEDGNDGNGAAAGAARTGLAGQCESLQTELERWRALAEGIPHLLWRSCDQGNWIWASPQWMSYTGLSQAESLGRGWLEAVHPEDRAATMAAWHDARAHGTLDVSFRARRADGAYFWHRTRSVPVRNPQGRIVEWLGSTSDIEDLKIYALRLEQEIGRREAIEAKLHFAAFHDDLTKLGSRALFMDALRAAIDRMDGDSGGRCAVLFMDVDRFKLVNDSLGHQAGDQLLIEISARLIACVSAGHTLARFGGDEFAILLDTNHRDDATELAECIERAMRAPIWLGPQEVFATCSIGIIEVSGRHRAAEEVLRDADVAMYSAKQKRWGRYAVFTDGMRHDAVEALRLRTDLRNAISRREFTLCYQPICNSRTGIIVGVEALIRWQHPSLGPVPPSVFIGVAEEIGCIREVGRWVLAEACTTWGRLAARFPGLKLRMSINASGEELKAGGYARHVIETLAEAGLDPAWLQVEVTESVLLGQHQVVADTLQELRALGVKIALDDFGTGYSSLSCLDSYEIDTIKIDQVFVSKIPAQARTLAIIVMIAHLARDLNLDVVAEGVEGEDQLATLREAGCGMVQGYMLGRPMPAEELAAAIGLNAISRAARE